MFILFVDMTCQSVALIATFQYGMSVLLRLCKRVVAGDIFLSDSTQRFYSKEKQNQATRKRSFPNQLSTDHHKRGRSHAILTDGLSKQMRNQNVCVVICGFSPLFACHYLLLSAHKVFIHTFTPTLHMAEEHTHAHKHMCKLSVQIGT